MVGRRLGKSWKEVGGKFEGGLGKFEERFGAGWKDV